MQYGKMAYLKKKQSYAQLFSLNLDFHIDNTNREKDLLAGNLLLNAHKR